MNEIKNSSIVQLEVTTKCNMNCFYCPIEDIPNNDMDMLLFYSIVSKYTEKTLFHLNGTGEPTLNKNLLRMILHIKENGHIVEFISNGKNQIPPAICSAVDAITFSVDEVDSDKIVKKLSISKDNIIHANGLCNRVNVLAVDYGQDLSEIEKFCDVNGIRFMSQMLHPTKAYQSKYEKAGHVPEKLNCMYAFSNRMDFYFTDGTMAPCCFMVKKENARSREYVRKSLVKGVVPDCCDGCYLIDKG